MPISDFINKFESKVKGLAGEADKALAGAMNRGMVATGKQAIKGKIQGVGDAAGRVSEVGKAVTGEDPLMLGATAGLSGLAGNLVASDQSGTSNLLKSLESMSIGGGLGSGLGYVAGKALENKVPGGAGIIPTLTTLLGGLGGSYLARRKNDEWDTRSDRAALDTIKRRGFAQEVLSHY